MEIFQTRNSVESMGIGNPFGNSGNEGNTSSVLTPHTQALACWDICMCAWRKPIEKRGAVLIPNLLK